MRACWSAEQAGPEGPGPTGRDARVICEREAIVSNREGLHFRPIMQLVDLAGRFTAQVSIECEDRRADARSPMELLMLVATQGSRLKLVGKGGDAREAVEALARLIESGFNEETETPPGTQVA